mmetsp:Transcript_12848/g.51691  ORF Transcript_12848/g.51691 Transcript_12848/m.51691 type:complete len:330 (+) Transcript_12848:277-1266(+)
MLRGHASVDVRRVPRGERAAAHDDVRAATRGVEPPAPVRGARVPVRERHDRGGSATERRHGREERRHRAVGVRGGGFAIRERVEGIEHHHHRASCVVVFVASAAPVPGAVRVGRPSAPGLVPGQDRDVARGGDRRAERVVLRGVRSIARARRVRVGDVRGHRADPPDASGRFHVRHVCAGVGREPPQQTREPRGVSGRVRTARDGARVPRRSRRVAPRGRLRRKFRGVRGRSPINRRAVASRAALPRGRRASRRRDGARGRGRARGGVCSRGEGPARVGGIRRHGWRRRRRRHSRRRRLVSGDDARGARGGTRGREGRRRGRRRRRRRG